MRQSKSKFLRKFLNWQNLLVRARWTARRCDRGKHAWLIFLFKKVQRWPGLFYFRILECDSAFGECGWGLHWKSASMKSLHLPNRPFPRRIRFISAGIVRTTLACERSDRLRSGVPMACFSPNAHGQLQSSQLTSTVLEQLELIEIENQVLTGSPDLKSIWNHTLCRSCSVNSFR